MKISVCILINQWHEKLPQLLTSAFNCSDDVLLGCNGEGKNLKEHPALKQFSSLRFIILEWSGYGATKNQLSQYAKYDWILSIDSDEDIDKTLQFEIQQLKEYSNCQVFNMQRLNFLGNKPIRHGAWGRNKKFIRLYNRCFTKWDNAAVHESIIEEPGMQIISLKGKLLHYTATDYKSFLQKNRHYATLAATERNQRSIIKRWLSPVFTFLKDYIFRLGFLDGKAGWQIAKGTALYTYWKYNLLAKK